MAADHNSSGMGPLLFRVFRYCSKRACTLSAAVLQSEFTGFMDFSPFYELILAHTITWPCENYACSPKEHDLSEIY